MQHPFRILALIVLGIAVVAVATLPSSRTVSATATVASVKTDGHTTCALTEEGALSCWGNNSFGQLGLGYEHDFSPRPIPVNGLNVDVAAFDLGFKHVCAVTPDATVYCWGLNYLGQLGADPRGEGLNGWVPPRLVPEVTAVAVAAGFNHTCVLTTAGGVQCWGLNGSDGTLGDGGGPSSYMPIVPVGLDSGVTAISSLNDGACVTTAEQEVLCWGGGFGAVPTEVVGFSGDIKQLAAGGGQVCAVTVGGSLECRWREEYVVAIANEVASVSIGFGHACFVTDDATVKCWGLNNGGQLGDGTRIDRSTPVEVSGLAGEAVAVSAGFLQTCVLLENGAPQCWGAGGFSGDGTAIGRITPVHVLFDSDRDGCGDLLEADADPTLGGSRSAKDFWDFFDTPDPALPPGPPDYQRDRTINMMDVLRVAARFGVGDPDDDPLKSPPASGYHPAYDRGPIVGENNWNRAPADGVINIRDDILGVAQQFGHTCV